MKKSIYLQSTSYNLEHLFFFTPKTPHQKLKLKLMPQGRLVVCVVQLSTLFTTVMCVSILSLIITASVRKHGGLPFALRVYAEKVSFPPPQSRLDSRYPLDKRFPELPTGELELSSGE